MCKLARVQRVKVIAPSIMPIAIDLHVKCSFYKNWKRKKTNNFFFHVKFSHGIWEANSYILPNFLSQGAVKNVLNFLTLQGWGELYPLWLTLTKSFFILCLIQIPCIPASLYFTSFSEEFVNIDTSPSKTGDDDLALDHLPWIDQQILYKCCPFLGEWVGGAKPFQLIELLHISHNAPWLWPVCRLSPLVAKWFDWFSVVCPYYRLVWPFGVWQKCMFKKWSKTLQNL